MEQQQMICLIVAGLLALVGLYCLYKQQQFDSDVKGTDALKKEQACKDALSHLQYSGLLMVVLGLVLAGGCYMK